MQGLM